MRLRIALLLFSLSPILVAQAPPNPFAEDAPETLLELELGDADVQFFGLGSWTTGIAPAAAWAFSRGSDGSMVAGLTSPFPGLEPVPFENRVDLTLSLWLLGRYFFETTISENLADSTILFGYAGLPGETVQSVIFGNTAIGMGAYPYLGFGDDSGSVGQDAPGAAGLFQTEVSEHEIMVRFSPTTEDSITWAGGGIVDENRIAASDYESDRHFVLPDGGLDFIDIYLEDPDGPITDDGGDRRYRRVDLSREVIVSLADGSVSFRESPVTRVLVYYEKAGSSIGSPGLGTDAFFARTDGSPDPNEPRTFTYDELGPPGGGTDYADLFGAGFDRDDFTVLIGGDRAFILYEPGRYSPFALASTYDAPDGDSVALESRAGNTVSTSIRLALDDGVLRAGDPAAGPRDFVNRYPFASNAFANPVPAIYGPSPRPDADAPELVVRSVRPADSIVLPSGFIPGSVRIVRNGTVEDRFVVLDSGEIDFAAPLGAYESVTVRYRTAASGEAGDLTVGIGNRVRIAPGTSGFLAAGARVRPIGTDYTTIPGEQPGEFTLSAGMETNSAEWETNRAGLLEARLDGAVSLAVSDTTGTLRLAGMNDDSSELAIVPERLVPSSATLVDPAAYGLGNIDQDDRGFLLFSDHYLTTVLGGREMLAYDDPAATDYPYEAGGRAGPFAARSFDEGFTGVVSVYDYDIAAPRTWVGGQIAFAGARDLSTVREVVLPYRVLDASGSVRVYVQIGSTAEDLDGDGTLDTGANGIAFSDAARGYELLAGTIPPAGETISEDINRNGVLDPELPERVLSLALPSPVTASSGGWVEERFPLTREDAAALAESRSVRLLIVRDTPAPAAGRILVGSLSLAGSGFQVDYPAGGASVQVRELPEEDVTGESFAEAFADRAAQLDGDQPPRLLAAGWSGLGADTITLQKSTSVPTSDYSAIELHARASDVGSQGTTIAVRAAGASGTIAETVTTVDSQSWRLIRLDLPPESTDVIYDVEIDLYGTDTATVYLDELLFVEPRTRFGAVGSLDVTLESDRTLRIGDLVLAEDLAFNQRLTVQSQTFPGSISAAQSGIESRTTLGAELLGVQAGFVTTARAAGGQPDDSGLLFSHEIDTASLNLPVSLRDEFRTGYGILSGSTTHVLGLTSAFSLAGTAGVRADWSTDSAGSGSEQEWSASLTHSGAQILDLETTLRLAEHTDQDEPAGSYPARWAGSLARLVPAGSPRIRSESIAFAATVTGDAVGVTGSLEAGGRTDALLDARSVTGSAELAVPLVLDGAEITARVSRRVILTTDGLPLATAVDDAAASAALLAAHPLLLTPVPFWELVDPGYPDKASIETLGLESAEYTPSFGIELTRRVESAPRAYLLPASAGVELSRPLERQLDSAFTAYEVSADATFVAPNVFGRLGSSPRFTFYDTDEYLGTIRLQSAGGDGAAWLHRIEAETRLRLRWTDGRGLTVSANGATELPGITPADLGTRLAYAWNGDEALVSRIPAPDALGGEPPSLEHETGLEVDVIAATHASVYTRIEHESVLQFGNSGWIRVYGGIGLGRVNTSGSPFTTLGIRAGIEGSLRL